MSKKEKKQSDEAVEEGQQTPEEKKAEGQAEEQPAVKTEEQRLAELAEDYKRKWYTVSAEYDNFRKRNSAAVSKAFSEGVAEAVLKLLPVADNFGYALSSAADEKTRAGIDKIIKNFNAILASFGIEEIPVKEGDEFDEKVAEAIMPTPCAEGEKPNVVKQVLKKGYRQGDKVIRFAQVAVTV